MNIGSAAGEPEEAPISRGLWVCAAAVITAALVVAPIADHRLAAHPNLAVAFFVLMAAADLLTAHLLVQQFLAGGRLSTLGLASAYLYSGVMMAPYAVAFTRIQHSGPGSIWSDICAPWLFFVLFAGFTLLVAARRRIVAALPARLARQARTRRRAAATVATAAVLALVAALTWLVLSGADWLPRFYQGGTLTAAGRWMGWVGLLTAALSLLSVIKGLRRRPPVERWVAVAISCSLATAILYLAAPIRYSLGWYATRVTLLLSAGVVLLALLAETASLYRRLSTAHEDLDQAHRELSRRAEHLAAANLELEAAGTWKSDIIATLTHEINQPLAVISAYSEELTQEWDTITDDERRAAVQALGDRVNQLLDMAAHLLTLCRAERGEIRTRPVALPVEQVLTQVTDNLTKQARVRVRASYGPPGAAVWADPVHTHEVLTNFVTNAVKYSPGDIHMSAALDDTGQEVLFAVSDEGNGVPPEFVAHLFDRFTQAEQPGAVRTGAGFGLYLSKLLAEANAGKVWYEDVVPHGGRFVLCLPSAQRSARTVASRAR
ncbi:MASE4 domain-containing protein [Actinoplanes sp. KI2]|uniref:sensor histidine kinase n=1 Tax=Actinoplanes sp. KI2 TaxID=2983315 RepID=UPI0021D58FB9|nr:ATP-binding protein [Actinoplanes sp. KI2]MCU7724180.1 MASE4 domain-containing protein [Actinoplanes sp. KI2]